MSSKLGFRRALIPAAKGVFVGVTDVVIVTVLDSVVVVVVVVNGWVEVKSVCVSVCVIVTWDAVSLSVVVVYMVETGGRLI